MQLHTNSSCLFNVPHALVYRHLRKTPRHVDFPETVWELSSQCCDAHRSLLTCICLWWTSFILGFLSMRLPLFTSPHTACLPNQSTNSFLDHWSYSPSLVPAYSSPNKVGQPVDKVLAKMIFFFFPLVDPISSKQSPILKEVPMIIKPSWLKPAVQTMVDMQDLSTPLPLTRRSKKTMRAQ